MEVAPQLLAHHVIPRLILSEHSAVAKALLDGLKVLPQVGALLPAHMKLLGSFLEELQKSRELEGVGPGA